MPKKVEREDYEERVKENLKKFKEILNKEFKLKLNKNFVSNILQFFHDLLNSIQPNNKESSFDNFYNNLPIKRSEYTTASLIYYDLNYNYNDKNLNTPIKITDFETITKLARQNLRKVLDYIADLSKNLKNYNFIYSKRETYKFNQKNYIRL